MKRQGFTLVEMLVAMTLTLFIMVILSQAFISGLDAFSQLKGLGDMGENLRVATTNLRSDLAQDHFEGKRRLSDATMLPGTPLYLAPKQGFFRVAYPTGTLSYSEGNDLDDGSLSYGLNTAASPPGTPNHMLHFTIKLRGNRRENFLSAAVPNPPAPALGLTNGTLNTNYFTQPSDAVYQLQNGGLVFSQWGEVAYFLQPQSGAQATTDGGTNLWGLYRAQFVVLPRNDGVNGQFAGGLLGSYANVACSVASDNSLYFYSPSDLARKPKAPSTSPPAVGTTVQARTFRPAVPLPLRSATLLTNNVVHFTVRVMTNTSGDFIDVPANNFDTATATTQIIALQIIIRVWDQKTQQSRQITIVQDM